MDRKTAELVDWARNYSPVENNLQLNDFIYIADLRKCLDTLSARCENTNRSRWFLAYKDNLIAIRKALEK